MTLLPKEYVTRLIPVCIKVPWENEINKLFMSENTFELQTNIYKNISWDHHLLLLPDLPALSLTTEKASLQAPSSHLCPAFPDCYH